jgi:hypothetical protein
MKSIEQVVRVQPGHRVEVVAPQFAEGDWVDVVVRECPSPPAPQARSLLAFLEGLPPGPRAFSNWESYEEHLREERESWDR